MEKIMMKKIIMKKGKKYEEGKEMKTEKKCSPDG